eukprot:COSAG03_NODE_32_length_18233_cov_11.266847_17_plen_48_part_00
MASSDSDDDDGDYGLSADVAAALLVRVQRRPLLEMYSRSFSAVPTYI